MLLILTLCPPLPHSLKVEDSKWSEPLDVGGSGGGNGGGAFTVFGGRWAQRGLPQEGSHGAPNQANAGGQGSSGGAAGKQAGGKDAYGAGGAQAVGIYNLDYIVSPAPPPWNRTRVVTLRARFTVANTGLTTLVFKQVGDNDRRTWTLKPGQSKPVHWKSVELEPLFNLSFPAVSEEGQGQGQGQGQGAGGDGAVERWRWSGGIDPTQIGTFSLCVRPHASSGRARTRTGSGEGASVGSGSGSGQRARIGSSGSANGGERGGGLRTVRVQVGMADTGGGGGDSGAVRIDMREEQPRRRHCALAPRANVRHAPPLVRIENHTRWHVYYSQVRWVCDIRWFKSVGSAACLFLLLTSAPHLPTQPSTAAAACDRTHRSALRRDHHSPPPPPHPRWALATFRRSTTWCRLGARRPLAGIFRAPLRPAAASS